MLSNVIYDSVCYRCVIYCPVLIGNNNVPHDTCAKLMYSEVAKYSDRKTNSCVKRCAICHLPWRP